MEATAPLITVHSSDLSNVLLLRHYFLIFNILITKKRDHEGDRRKNREKEVEWGCGTVRASTLMTYKVSPEHAMKANVGVEL